MEIDNMDKFIIGENSSGKTRKMLEEAKRKLMNFYNIAAFFDLGEL